jgi:hypothetical protein
MSGSQSVKRPVRVVGGGRHKDNDEDADGDDDHGAAPSTTYRLRFVSQKKRAQNASAKISYRHEMDDEAARIRRKKVKREMEAAEGGNDDTLAEQKSTGGGVPAWSTTANAADEEASAVEDISSSQPSTTTMIGPSKFAVELELALMRNGSEPFAACHRHVWPLTRSLPELLHNAGSVFDHLIDSLTSTVVVEATSTNSNDEDEDEEEGEPPLDGVERDNEDEEDVDEIDEDAADDIGIDDDDVDAEGEDAANADPDPNADGAGDPPRRHKSFNLATIDVLHLMAVLADDLRHEIHPHLHSKVLPCLLGDLLDVLRNSGGGGGGGGGGGNDDVVAIAEAIFRTTAYVFRYDAAMLLAEEGSGDKATTAKGESKGRKRKKASASAKTMPCLEPLRRYYGATLPHPRAVVRKLAAETFATLVRQLPSHALKGHLKRVLKAFAAQADYSVQSQSAGSIHQQKRLVRDATDGISHLLWFVARGVARQLHSTAGRIALDAVLGSVAAAGGSGGVVRGSGADAGADAVTDEGSTTPVQFDVAALFFQHLCRHLAQPPAQQQEKDRGVHVVVVAAVLRSVLRHASASYKAVGVGTATATAAAAAPLSCYFALLQQVVDFRSNVLVRSLVRRNVENSDEDEDTDSESGGAQEGSSSMNGVLDDLLEIPGRVLGGAADNDTNAPVHWPDSCRSSAVQLLCSVWAAAAAAAPSAYRTETIATIRANVARALRGDHETLGSGSIESIGKIVVQDLLVRLPDGPAAMESVGSILLSSAARGVEGSSSDVVNSLVLSVALSTRALRHRSASSISAGTRRPDSDRFVEWSLAQHATLDVDERERLIQKFISASPVNLDAIDPAACSELAERVVCASFCALTTGKGSANSTRIDVACLEWLLDVGDAVGQATECERVGCPDGETRSASRRLAALMSLVLECAAAVISPLVMLRVMSSGGNPGAGAQLKRLQQLAERHLLGFPQSPSAVKSAAAVTRILSRLNHNVVLATDDVFDALIPNLRHESHFLRLHSLEVLAALPSRPYVVDHADLDLSQDLDEEPASRGPAQGSDRAPLSGMSDVLNILLRIETTSATLLEERVLLSLIGRVEVLGRSGRLPVVHAEAAASHMLGLLYSKFAPVWPAAVRAVAGLARGHEDCVWPWVQRRLASLSGTNHSPSDETGDEDFDCPGFFGTLVLRAEKGDTSPFQDDLDYAKEVGYVSRHESADPVAVFETSWSVVEKAPSLMTRHSKLLVPLFLRFMHFQFFGGNLDDPDARELKLLTHLDESSTRYAARLSEAPVD